MNLLDSNTMYIILKCQPSEGRTSALHWFRKGLVHTRNRINNNPILQTIEQLDKEIKTLDRHLKAGDTRTILDLINDENNMRKKK